ncbi:MAG: putative Ig domain-containing protein [Blastocatellia bacterium]
MKRSVRRYPLALLLSLLLLSGFTIYTNQALGFTISKSANYLRQALTQPAKPGGGHAAIAKPIQQSNNPTETAMEPAQGALTIPQNVLPGGGGTSTGGSNTLTGTIGQGVVGASSGGNFSLSGGFLGAISGSQCPTIAISPPTLPNAQLGQPYSQQLGEMGGTGTIAWTISAGALPNGMTLNASTGLLSGAPMASGFFTFTVKATDANVCMGVQAYTLAIGCPVITISPTSLPSGTVNTPYSQKLTATGGIPPYAFSPNTGSAPTGLTLMSDGTLAGTPTMANTFTFSVKVTDAAGCTGQSATYNLTINPVVANNSIAGTVSYCITPAQKIPGVTVATNGATPITSITNTQGGYSLTGLGSGAVVVTPTKTPNNNAISSFDAALIQQQVIGLANLNLTDCQKSAGDSNNSGGNVSSFDAALIQQFVVGTAPAAGSVVGTWKMTPASRSYPSVSGAVTGQDYDAVLVGDVSGNWTPPQSLAEAESFNVPFQQTPISLPTTSVAPGSTITVPVSIGTSLTGQGVIAYQFTLNFNPSVLQLQNPAFDTAGTVSTANGFSVLANSPIAGRLVVSGSGPNALSGTGTLLNLKFTVIGAAGNSSPLTITPSSFLLNETVQTNVTNGNISVTGGGGGLQVPISLANSSAAPAANVTVPVTLGSTLTGLNVIAYQFTLNFDPNVLELQNPAFDTAGTVSTANGFSVLANSPVAGRLVVSGSGPNALSGTGTLLNLKLKVKGAAGTSSALTFAPSSFLLNETVQTNVTNGNLSVVQTCQTITITPATLASGQLGQPYSRQLTQTGGAGTIAWTISAGALPNGVTLNASTGLLSGTPVASGSFTFTIKATDANGCMGTQGYTLVIGCPVITISPTSLPAAVRGQAYSQTLTATGGTPNYTFSFDGTPPSGLSLSAAGALTGSGSYPAGITSLSFAVKVTDAGGCTGTQSYTVSITAGTYTVSGRVVDQAGNGIADVSMTYRNSAGVLGGPRTDANGNWTDSNISSIPHSCAEPFSVTPSKSGFTFTPLSRTFCAASSTLNFTGATVVTTVSAASFLGNEIAPESIVAAFGVNLATKVEIASATPLPTTLAGTTVKVKDSAGTERLSPLFFVAPSQVNYQVPPNTAVGLASVTVTSGDNKISLGTINVAKVAPGLFSANASGQGVAAAVLLRIRNGVQTFESVSRFDQAAGGQVPVEIDMGPAGDIIYLLAYGSGLRGRTAAGNISVNLGDIVKSLNPNDFEDVFATPGFIGLDQASILLPRTLIGKGLINLTMTVDGKASNTVQIRIK